jgi:hypothetical protein
MGATPSRLAASVWVSFLPSTASRMALIRAERVFILAALAREFSSAS